MLSALFTNSFLSFALLLTPPPASDAASVVRYRYFDEYLIHLDVGEQAYIIGEEIEGSGDVEIGRNVGSIFNRPLPIRSGVKHNKDVTCCMLGQLAGDKGYHCTASFYEARLISRNYNRAHNRRIESLQPRSPNKGSAEKLMRTFGQCVSRGVIFHKCCHITVMENFQKKNEKPRKESVQRRRIES